MSDDRIDPPLAADERETLATFLDWQRDTLALKCAGLTGEQLRLRAVEPSGMSLLGLVRHLAHVERAWFRHILCDEDVSYLWGKATNPDADFDDVDEASPEEAFAAWRAEVEHAREVSAGLPLDALGKRLRRGEAYSHRWILVHMIEEYARHNGHADLLRERIDGATGE
ncbi:DinB family protein [Nonomuraea roseoviolacea]|uniref:Damage-inducible protein DinB n=1 Tax=Nonomuraea roseoviolacea subsp. carminata TaxID=160689 RepID=A0ABT1JVF8_9ACTN|nr:DinB family protein [Nonomuraea roseoviolacea]MCP2345731.1 putative damage-inducible protein DinB [Nonomuraea roseoviolacea subsp. carminata]